MCHNYAGGDKFKNITDSSIANAKASLGEPTCININMPMSFWKARYTYDAST